MNLLLSPPSERKSTKPIMMVWPKLKKKIRGPRRSGRYCFVFVRRIPPVNGSADGNAKITLARPTCKQYGYGAKSNLYILSISLL